jgi:acyl-CoA dehydrogenase
LASHVLVVLGARPLLLDAATATVRPAGFVLDAGLRWSPPAMNAALPLDGLGAVPDVQLLLGCINAVQLAGALQAVFSQTLQYANDREQFGRPIGKFQAIQHQLSVMAEHTFAARMAAQIGCQGAHQLGRAGSGGAKPFHPRCYWFHA